MAEKVKEETPATPVEEERQEEERQEVPAEKPRRRRARTAPPPADDDDPVIDLDQRVGALEEEAAMSRKPRTDEPEVSNQWPWILAAIATLGALLLATRYKTQIAERLASFRPGSSSPPPGAP